MYSHVKSYIDSNTVDRQFFQMDPEQINQTIPGMQDEKLLTPLSSIPLEPAPYWFSKRFLVAILMGACYVNISFIRCSISIAVVEMTSNKSVKMGNLTTIQPAEFDWDSNAVGIVLSAFYYGGLFSLIGGPVVTKLGGAVGCALFTMLCGFALVLHPSCLNYGGFYTFLGCRVLTGIFEGLMQVSMSDVYSKWMPRNEKSKLMSFVVNGINVGITIVHGFSAFLANGWGWTMIFYATGGISMFMSLVCFILVENQPSEDKWISKKEQLYIQQETVTVSTKKVRHPYKKIFLLAPIWALAFSNFTYMWWGTILNILLPLFVKDVTQGNITKVGLLSSLPNAVSILMIPICGTLLDYMKRSDISQTRVHKVFLCGAYIIGSTLFLGMVLISNFVVSLISFILLQVLISVVTLISQVLMISIAPKSTSVISGLCTFVNALSCIMTRHVTGFMTMNHSLEEWNHCFILVSGLLLLGAAIFALYGSSEAQQWSRSTVTECEETSREFDEVK